MKKRTRTIFTESQLQRLEKEFSRQQYIVGNGRIELATALNLSELQVRNQQRTLSKLPPEL